MSGERTVTDPVEEIDPDDAAVEPVPAPRRGLARLPPLGEILSRASAPPRQRDEPTTRDAAPAAPGVSSAEDPSRAEDGQPARRSLARLPPLRDVRSAAVPPRQEITLPDPVEEIDPGEVALGPPPVPSAPPTFAETVEDVAREGSLRDGPRDVAVGGPSDDEASLSLETDALPGLASVERPSAATVIEGSTTLYCQSCERRVPRGEMRMLTREGVKAFPVCPNCKGYLGTSPGAAPRLLAAAPRASSPARSAAAAPRAGSLAWMLVEAAGWPVTRQALPTLLGLSCLVWLLSSAWAFDLPPVATPAGLTLTIALLAVRAATVVHATHRGEVTMPLFGDDVAAVLRHLVVLLLGGLPLFAALSSEGLGVRSPTDRTLLVVAAVAAFCLYVPAGQIVVASRETFGAALNPFRPVRFALRVGRAYLLPCAILLVIAIAHLVAVGVAMIVGVALWGRPTVWWGGLVSLVVVAGVLAEARALGLVVREHSFDLGLT